MRLLQFSSRTRWESDMTSDMGAMKIAVDSMNWMGYTTNTDGALREALAGFESARSDAQHVVILITDGKPTRPSSLYKTYMAAKKLKEKARLIVVPIMYYGSFKRIIKNVEEWPSRPLSENMVKVNGFNELAGAKFVNSLIENTCPGVFVG